MITISEHTLDESLIKKGGWILDLGCVNFTFAEEIKKYTKNIICVDPNPEIEKNSKFNLLDGKLTKILKTN